METKPELISFKLCPFVQRSVITLLQKNVAFDMTHIDLFNKPDWFLKLSPSGKVPVLKVDDVVLFESAVINEYLDEIYPPSLHPHNALQKAQNRAWTEFGTEVIMNMAKYYKCTEKKDFEQQRELLVKNLSRLEQQLGEGPFFNGKTFSLIDAAYAPLFMRLSIIETQFSHSLLQAFPRLQTWSKALLDLDFVKKSVAADFTELFLAMIKKNNSFIAQNP